MGLQNVQKKPTVTVGNKGSTNVTGFGLSRAFQASSLPGPNDLIKIVLKHSTILYLARRPDRPSDPIIAGEYEWSPWSLASQYSYWRFLKDNCIGCSIQHDEELLKIAQRGILRTNWIEELVLLQEQLKSSWCKVIASASETWELLSVEPETGPGYSTVL